MEYPVLTAQPLLLHAGGFSLFGREHLLWLCGCAVLVFALVRSYHRLASGPRGIGEPGAVRLLRAMAVAMLALLASDDALMVASGTFTAPWWPLHFCNFAEYFSLAYAIRPNRPCRELLLTIGMAGGITALLFPGWSYCPAYTWPVICGFLEHSLILATSLCAVTAPAPRPRRRDVWFSLGFVACYAAFFRWFNAAMGTNFGFLNEAAAGSPLWVWQEWLGNPGYLVPYALSFVVADVVAHLSYARG